MPKEYKLSRFHSITRFPLKKSFEIYIHVLGQGLKS
jgi:hypothetical protein